MEAAGLINTFSRLVAQVICNYADSHKTMAWQTFAASTTAASAKKLLSIIPGIDSQYIIHEFGRSLYEWEKYSEADKEVRKAAEDRERLFREDRLDSLGLSSRLAPHYIS
ncbi:hypothetical protein BGZ63DRAFT_405404 [Mariannaea sp. PMI_226]|nr:hypothetical protein BGZ63DRAFT_405404 [Mariannaea sp. PMI_226]